MDYRVHGILQARILEWVAFSFSRGSSQHRHWTQVSHIAGRFFTSWATREALLYINYGCISQVNIEPAWLMSLAWNIKKSYWLASPWISKGRPKWHRGKKSTCQWRRQRRHRFDSCVRKIPWRRTWQPTPVHLPGKFHGQRSLSSYSPWGHKRVKHDSVAKQQMT